MSDDVPRERPRAWIGWAIAIVIVIVLACAGWIGVRGLGAATALSSADRNATQLRTLLATGEVADARGVARRIAAETENAALLTSDPVWRTLEGVPWLGGDLRALRVVAQASDKVARDSLPTLIEAAEAVDLSTLGAAPLELDAARLDMAGATLLSAAKAAGVAARMLADIDPDGLITPLGDTVRGAHGEIMATAQATGALAEAAVILPRLTAGDHTYLIVIEDASGIRSEGVAPVAYLPVRVRDGAIALGAIAGPTAIDAAAGLAAEDFAEGGLAVATAWSAAKKVRVSGLIALDLEALGGLVAATGPLTIDGVEVTPANAVELLRAGIDAERPEGAAAFRTLAAATILARVVDGTAAPFASIGALSAATDGGHVRAWFDDPEIQDRLASSPLAG